MRKKLRKIIGILLIASPFVVILILAIVDLGIIITLKGIALLTLLFLIIGTGGYLIES